MLDNTMCVPSRKAVLALRDRAELAFNAADEARRKGDYEEAERQLKLHEICYNAFRKADDNLIRYQNQLRERQRREWEVRAAEVRNDRLLDFSNGIPF